MHGTLGAKPRRENFPEITLRKINKDIILANFDRKKMATIILRTGLLVAKYYTEPCSIAELGMVEALILAEKGSYRDIRNIATERMERDLNTEKEIDIRVRDFLHHCINLSAEEVHRDERPEYFEWLEKGLKLIHESNPEACLTNIYGTTASIREEEP